MPQSAFVTAQKKEESAEIARPAARNDKFQVDESIHNLDAAD